MRGVQRAVAPTAAAAVADDEAAYRATERRARSLASLDYGTFRSRMASFVQRRGFGWETARTAIERCWRELGGDAVEDDT
jgi:hypothetical protein